MYSCSVCGIGLCSNCVLKEIIFLVALVSHNRFVIKNSQNFSCKKNFKDYMMCHHYNAELRKWYWLVT